MTLGQLFYFYMKGTEFEQQRVKYQATMTGAASNGVFPEDDEPKEQDQTPDRAGIRALLGSHPQGTYRSG